MSEIFSDIQYLSSTQDEPRWQSGEIPTSYLERCLAAKWKGALDSLRRQAASKKYEENKPLGLIVADTIVVLKGEVLGKPSGPQEARKMLSKLSQKKHLVYTGVGLARFKDGLREPLQNLKPRYFKTATEIEFYRLSSKEIQAYIQSGEPFDKAGAYGFQDRALAFVRTVKGSYLNVVGLPLADLKKEAEKLGFK